MTRTIGPTVDETMIRTLVNGTMLNCSATPEDVRLAARIYGRLAMGRWKDRGPKRALEVLVPKQTPKEQKSRSYYLS